MLSSKWSRCSGLAAMAGGALMMVGVLQLFDPEHRVAQKLLYLWPVIPMLFLVAVAELFKRRYPGWLAKAALMLAFLGAAGSALAGHLGVVQDASGIWNQPSRDGGALGWPGGLWHRGPPA